VQREQEQTVGYWRQCVERAGYEAEFSRGRYEAVDAANRLVAAELERRWNEAQDHVQEVRREADEPLADLMHEPSEVKRARAPRIAENVAQIWGAPPTASRDHKRLLSSVWS